MKNYSDNDGMPIKDLKDGETLKQTFDVVVPDEGIPIFGENKFIYGSEIREAPTNNPVFHPNHYNWVPDIECLDVVQHFNFNLGCAIKYIWRAPYRQAFKPSDNRAIEDLEKGIFYLEQEIKRLNKEKEIMNDTG